MGGWRGGKACSLPTIEVSQERPAVCQMTKLRAATLMTQEGFAVCLDRTGWVFDAVYTHSTAHGVCSRGEVLPVAR